MNGQTSIHDARTLPRTMLRAAPQYAHRRKPQTLLPRLTVAEVADETPITTPRPSTRSLGHSRIQTRFHEFRPHFTTRPCILSPAPQPHRPSCKPLARLAKVLVTGEPRDLSCFYKWSAEWSPQRRLTSRRKIRTPPILLTLAPRGIGAKSAHSSPVLTSPPKPTRKLSRYAQRHSRVRSFEMAQTLIKAASGFPS